MLWAQHPNFTDEAGVCVQSRTVTFSGHRDAPGDCSQEPPPLPFILSDPVQ